MVPGSFGWGVFVFPITAIFAPSFAAFMAMACPMPRVAPVIKRTLSLRFMLVSKRRKKTDTCQYKNGMVMWLFFRRKCMRFKFYFVLICFFHVAISHAQQKKVEDPRLQELHALYALRDQSQALIDAGILMSKIQDLTLKYGMIDYLKALDALPGSERGLVSPTPSKMAQH